jgi:acetyl esterase
MDEKKIKDDLISVSKRTSLINQKIKAHGSRYLLPLEDRDIEIVYYAAESDRAPVIFGMHGGGFLIGGCAFDDRMWDHMRTTLNVNIVSIGYRKTPEYPFPAALHDVYDAMVYVIDKMPELSFDRDKICVFGNSAGTTLAAAVCLLAKEKGYPTIKAQILNYPFLDLASDPAEKGDSGQELIESLLFNELYIKNADPKDPLLSPVYAEDLSGLPSAIMMVCEHDTLRAEGELYAKRLKEAGVEVSLYLAKDMHHAFFEQNYAKALPTDPDSIKAFRENGRMAEESANTLAHIKAQLEKLHII